jgi:2-dehydro-3-deoxyphosphogluconate aldolase / (4S)-4-hydroxy-2-oxoglutarate aldolase
MILDALAEGRVLAVVRASTIPDAAELCEALVAGGIRCVELTFTTPGLPGHLRRASGICRLGAGTVLNRADAVAAVDAGAEFLVTPGVLPEVAAVGRDRGVPVFMGALTPTEILGALNLGAAAVKIFPAYAFGPRYLKDLHGPLPGVPLIPSGGITAANAHEFLVQGALAVSAGTGVVPPDAVAAGNWAEITRRARAFVTPLEGHP